MTSCVCPSRTYQLNEACVACAVGCRACATTASNCYSCEASFEVYRGSCVCMPAHVLA